MATPPSSSPTNPPPPRILKPRAPPSTRTCLCSPTTHPGSFRCILHRSHRGKSSSAARSSSFSPSRAGSGASARAEAKGAASREGNGGLRAVLLLQIIRPSRHNLCRRRNFQPKPTRFCVMDGSGRGVGVV